MIIPASSFAYAEHIFNPDAHAQYLDISQLEDDADLRMIEATNITANLLGVGGLVDVIAATPSNITTGGFEVQLNTPFGGVTSPIPAEGMTITDFSIYNQTTMLAVVPTTVTESAVIGGLYTFTFPAQTSLDVLLVSNTLVSPLTKSYDLVPFVVNIP